jgi:hypothetical protein
MTISSLSVYILLLTWYEAAYAFIDEWYQEFKRRYITYFYFYAREILMIIFWYYNTDIWCQVYILAMLISTSQPNSVKVNTASGFPPQTKTMWSCDKEHSENVYFVWEVTFAVKFTELFHNKSNIKYRLACLLRSDIITHRQLTNAEHVLSITVAINMNHDTEC